jgi:hypothetical protein
MRHQRAASLVSGRGRREDTGSDTGPVLEDTSIAIDCPKCTCKVAASLARVMASAGVFCPACQIYISFTDERAGVREADRILDQFLREFPKTIEVNFEL